MNKRLIASILLGLLVSGSTIQKSQAQGDSNAAVSIVVVGVPVVWVVWKLLQSKYYSNCLSDVDSFLADPDGRIDNVDDAADFFYFFNWRKTNLFGDGDFWVTPNELRNARHSDVMTSLYLDLHRERAYIFTDRETKTVFRPEFEIVKNKKVLALSSLRALRAALQAEDEILKNHMDGVKVINSTYLLGLNVSDSFLEEDLKAQNPGGLNALEGLLQEANLDAVKAQFMQNYPEGFMRLCNDAANVYWGLAVAHCRLLALRNHIESEIYVRENGVAVDTQKFDRLLAELRRVNRLLAAELVQGDFVNLRIMTDVAIAELNRRWGAALTADQQDVIDDLHVMKDGFNQVITYLLEGRPADARRSVRQLFRQYRNVHQVLIELL